MKLAGKIRVAVREGGHRHGERADHLQGNVECLEAHAGLSLPSFDESP